MVGSNGKHFQCSTLANNNNIVDGSEKCSGRFQVVTNDDESDTEIISPSKYAARFIVCVIISDSRTVSPKGDQTPTMKTHYNTTMVAYNFSVVSILFASMVSISHRCVSS